MRRQLTCLFGVFGFVLAGCPPATEQDGGGADAAGYDHATVDHRVADGPVSDGGGRELAATDTSGTDRLGVDSGPIDAGNCTPPSFTACNGINPSGSSYTLVTTGTPGISGTRTFSVGATRADVLTAMGAAAETAAAFNAFAVIYCAEGLVLYFADDLSASGTAAHEGELSPTDRLYKITAFGNFNGATDTGTALALGDTATEATTALGTADFTGSGASVAGATGEYRFWYAGHSVLLIGGAVETMSVHAPQTPIGTLDDAINFSTSTIGAVSVSNILVAQIPIATGSSLTQIRSAFGSAPEADGDMTITIGSLPINVVVLSYSVLGLRFSGPASQTQSGDSRKVYTAVLTAPFQGKDGAIGIGSARADIEARFGAATADAPDSEGRVLYRYNTGSRRTGVYYVWDGACVQRAAVFIVNLIESN